MNVCVVFLSLMHVDGVSFFGFWFVSEHGADEHKTSPDSSQRDVFVLRTKVFPNTVLKHYS